jgi:hypothetical protein
MKFASATISFQSGTVLEIVERESITGLLEASATLHDLLIHLNRFQDFDHHPVLRKHGGEIANQQFYEGAAAGRQPFDSEKQNAVNG